MRINFHGKLIDENEIRVGFVGCGSHAFRNIFPTFQFAPVKLVATCDLELEKAQAFAAKFGAENAYDDYHRMLEQEDLDAVFTVTGYDDIGKPLYPPIIKAALEAGCHVWSEKPPAASVAVIEELQAAAAQANRQVMIGFKKMFFPANEKAKALTEQSDFGQVSFATFEYPQRIPTVEELVAYQVEDQRIWPVVGFLDHLCHPAALMHYLLGPPSTLFYQRSHNGAGTATLTYDSGVVATLAFTYGSANRDGMERTTIVSDTDRHIIVDNNLRVSYHRIPRLGYGDVPDFYSTEPDNTTTVWQPEFSLGQLYNKGLFILGYFNEVNEFARAILEGRPLRKGTLEDAWYLTHLFEAFLAGPGKVIQLKNKLS
jgi:predicted dehydrogenase